MTPIVLQSTEHAARALKPAALLFEPYVALFISIYSQPKRSKLRSGIKKQHSKLVPIQTTRARWKLTGGRMVYSIVLMQTVSMKSELSRGGANIRKSNQSHDGHTIKF